MDVFYISRLAKAAVDKVLGGQSKTSKIKKTLTNHLSLQSWWRVFQDGSDKKTVIEGELVQSPRHFFIPAGMMLIGPGNSNAVTTTALPPGGHDAPGQNSFFTLHCSSWFIHLLYKWLPTLMLKPPHKVSIHTGLCNYTTCCASVTGFFQNKNRKDPLA